MITALLSNTPASGLRGSGLAGDTGLTTDEPSLGRGGANAREAAASPAAVSRAAGRVPPLSPNAVLALQEGDQAQATGARRSGDQGDQASARQQAGQPGQTQADQAQRPVQGDGQTQGQPQGLAQGQAQSETPGQNQGTADRADDPDGDGLNEAQEKQVQDLKQRDREVRAHEQAHARVGGQYASAPSYTFQQGPDGKRYAIGGEVQIDTSTERTPEATIRKMQIVIRAALAPAEPSSQDLRVAQQARASLSDAQSELRQLQAAERLDNEDDTTGAVSINGADRNSSAENPTPTGRESGNSQGSSFNAEAREASAVYARAVDQARQGSGAGALADQLF